MDRNALARMFRAGSVDFASSPLYGRLTQVVADDDRLLAIAAEARAGQLPTNLFLAAVRYLRLGGLTEPADFTEFCLAHTDELIGLMRTRLVQTNVVKRAAALRLGLSQLPYGPVTLVEVGCSAGVQLRFDEYAYEIGGRTWGAPSSPVVIRTDWRGPVPDLDRLPEITDRLGIDLHPVDATDPDQRRWLDALVWPENEAQAELLGAALGVVAADPPRMIAGDAIDLLPTLDPAGPVVVFHAATRLHMGDRRTDFDQAIRDLAARCDVFHLSLEASRDLSAEMGIPVFALTLRHGTRPPRVLAAADGHVEWIVPRDVS